VSLTIVGKGRKFEILEGDAVDPYLSAIAGEERRGGRGQQQQAEEEVNKKWKGNHKQTFH